MRVGNHNLATAAPAPTPRRLPAYALTSVSMGKAASVSSAARPPSTSSVTRSAWSAGAGGGAGATEKKGERGGLSNLRLPLRRPPASARHRRARAPMLFLVCRFHTTMCAPHAAMGCSLPPSEAVADAASCTGGRERGYTGDLCSRSLPRSQPAAHATGSTLAPLSLPHSSRSHLQQRVRLHLQRDDVGHGRLQQLQQAAVAVRRELRAKTGGGVGVDGWKKAAKATCVSLRPGLPPQRLSLATKHAATQLSRSRSCCGACALRTLVDVRPWLA
jgi:hypothetical protein